MDKMSVDGNVHTPGVDGTCDAASSFFASLFFVPGLPTNSGVMGSTEPGFGLRPTRGFEGRSSSSSAAS